MDKKFDIIIYGATGFTGQLCVKYLSKNANDISWAIAGRNKDKLENLKTELSLNVDIFVANSDDHEALDEITKNTKVVLSTAGPFHRYSSNLVKSCVKNSSHYVDITGEFFWIRDMIDLHHEDAKDNNVRIVNSCGFDSIPSDMGVYYIHKNISQKNLSIKMRVTGAKGTYSGGTYASMQNIIKEAFKDKEVRKSLTNPYGLNPVGQQEIGRASCRERV